VTPFDRTRGRLLANAASLLVIFPEQALKGQEPASAAAETIHRLCNFADGLQEFSLLSVASSKHPLTSFSESTYSLRSYRSGSLLERRVCKPPALVRALRTRIPAQAALNAASENS
jgi:hypothetical protein